MVCVLLAPNEKTLFSLHHVWHCVPAASQEPGFHTADTESKISKGGHKTTAAFHPLLGKIPIGKHRSIVRLPKTSPFHEKLKMDIVLNLLLSCSSSPSTLLKSFTCLKCINPVWIWRSYTNSFRNSIIYERYIKRNEQMHCLSPVVGFK